MITRKFVFFLSLFAFVASACSPSHTSWYRSYSGKIGEMDVILHLVSSANYSGYLWMKGRERPVHMTGAGAEDSAALTSTDGTLFIELKGNFSKNKFVGKAIVNLQSNEPSGKDETFSLAPDDNFSNFRVFSASASAGLPEQLHNSSNFSSFRMAIWPEADDSLAATLKSVISDVMNLRSSKDITEILTDSADAERDRWLQAIKEMPPAELADMGISLSEAIEETVSVLYEDQHTITLAHFAYSYTGGAHGNYHTTFYPISKAWHKTLALSDILTGEGISRLPAIVDKVVRHQYDVGMGSLRSAGFFEDSIPVSNNFYITAKGIGLIYSTYEILPYAAGEPDIFISFDDVKAFLKDDFTAAHGIKK